MPVETFTVAANGRLADGLEPVLTAHGFVRVASNVSIGGALHYNANNSTYPASGGVDVFRAPAELTQSGVEWYLAVAQFINSTATLGMLTVAEGFDQATGRLIRYAPRVNNVAPAADFSIGATPGDPSDASWLSPVSWTTTAGTTARLNVTIDRLIFMNSGQYIGQALPIRPPSMDPAPPLVGAPLMGLSANNANYGITTREIAQTAAGAYNFRVNATGDAYVHGRVAGTYQSDGIDSITGKKFLSPMALQAARGNISAWRCVLYDIRLMSTTNPNTTDTLTENYDGVTRTYSTLWTKGIWMPEF